MERNKSDKKKAEKLVSLIGIPKAIEHVRRFQIAMRIRDGNATDEEIEQARRFSDEKP
jgi:hypothetical protein